MSYFFHLVQANKSFEISSPQNGLKMINLHYLPLSLLLLLLLPGVAATEVYIQHVGSATYDAVAQMYEHSFPTAPEAQLPSLESGQSAIVVNQNNGQVLGVKQPDEKRPMASTTKMMTALLVIEKINAGTLELDDIVVISTNAGTMGDRDAGGRAKGSIMGDCGEDGTACPNTPLDCPGDGQDCSVGLSLGDLISIEDLLYGLLLDSANDAAIALAETVSGSEANFVVEMNSRAASLNLANTKFANSHGRDPQKIIPDDCPDIDFDSEICGHYSTARDLATLARFALQDPLFAQIVSTRTYQTKEWSARNNDEVDGSMDNSNRLIRGTPDSNPYFYNGAMGVKTGTTQRAGRCLVAAATRQQGSVITVVLGAENNDDRYKDSRRLLNYGFEALYDLNSKYVSQSVPSVIPSGQSAQASVTLRNTGNVDWIASDKLVSRASGWLQNEVTLGKRVVPGQQITIQIQLFPSSSGNYQFRWQMSRPFRGKFGAVTPAVTVHVEGDCASLQQQHQQILAELRGVQAEFHTAPPKLKPFLSSEVSRLQGALDAITLQLQSAGCH